MECNTAGANMRRCHGGGAVCKTAFRGFDSLLVLSSEYQVDYTMGAQRGPPRPDKLGRVGSTPTLPPLRSTSPCRCPALVPSDGTPPSKRLFVGSTPTKGAVKTIRAS